MSQKEAEVLRGRLIWFESFMFGRIANRSLHAIGSTCNFKTDQLKRTLKFFQTRILNGPPIEIRAAVGEVIHIFTVGAFEPELINPGTVGGVTYSEKGERLGFFSEVVPIELMIVELLAALVALAVWGDAYPHRYVVNYIDNEASRSALIKAWSSVRYANNIIGNYVELERKSPWKPWFSRVASFSNPRDDPSRLKIGCAEIFFDWPSAMQHLDGDAQF